MKTLMYFFVMALIVMAGCAKDYTMFETHDNLELKRAKVTIPFNSDNRAVAHPVIQGRYMISGTATHAGKINPQESFYQFTSMVPIEINGEPFLHLAGFGKLVGANGHGMEFTFWSYQTMDLSSYQGEIMLTPGTGTGQFAGATGTFNSSGGAVPGEYTFSKITGYLVYE